MDLHERLFAKADTFYFYPEGFQAAELEPGDLCLYTLEDSQPRYTSVLNVFEHDEVTPEKSGSDT